MIVDELQRDYEALQLAHSKRLDQLKYAEQMVNKLFTRIAYFGDPRIARDLHDEWIAR